MTPSEQQRVRMTDDTTSSETQRLEALKDLVRRRAYDVPAEDVAARIIGNAFGLAAPARPGRS
jgi:anti-sigma28 factor (negative regulator of flagellin synthesis)